MKKLKLILSLFWTMFKIGLFTFGGGYAMIAIIEREIVENKEWLTHDEFMDIIAIAESSPGPLAINTATFVGYKIAGVLGSIFATLAVTIPSFVIIFVISLFFEQFVQIKWVGYAFQGIQVCVAYLILMAGIKMFKHLEKNVFNIVLFIASLCVLVAFSLFSISFSSIFYILIGGGIGILLYLMGFIKSNKKSIKNVDCEKGEND